MSSPEKARPAATGTLDERPIPRLLHQLMRKQVTGWLVVREPVKGGGEGADSTVFLRDGAPVHVQRPDDADRLDQVVAAAGLVSAQVLREVSAALPAGKRLGEVLIERGLVAEATLADLLKVQMKRKLHRLFGSRQGSWAIYVGAHNFGAGGEFREMRVDPRCLVYEGIRAAYDEDRLRAELGPLAGRRFRLLRSVPASLLEAMGFPHGDATVAALDGPPRRLADLPPAGVAAKEALAVVLALLYTDLLEAEAQAAGKPGTTVVPALASSGSMPAVAAKPAAAPLTDAALATRIDELLARIDTVSHFELLGIPENASTEEISAAFLRRMRELHPDRLAGRGLRDLAAKAARLVARINEANVVLIDPKQRAAYLAARAPGAIAPVSAMDLARAVLNAEESFRKGELALRKGDYTQALEAFTAASRDQPQEPIYGAYATWARFNVPGANKDRLVRETIVALGNVIAERPKFALARHWQGLLYKHNGDLVAAEAAFRAAVAEDKTLLDAERELRVLEMRRVRAATLAAANPDKPTAVSAAKPRGLADKLLKR
jgi:DnaJ-domain-containing protein 1